MLINFTFQKPNKPKIELSMVKATRTTGHQDRVTKISSSLSVLKAAIIFGDLDHQDCSVVSELNNMLGFMERGSGDSYLDDGFYSISLLSKKHIYQYEISVKDYKVIEEELKRSNLNGNATITVFNRNSGKFLKSIFPKNRKTEHNLKYIMEYAKKQGRPALSEISKIGNLTINNPYIFISRYNSGHPLSNINDLKNRLQDHGQIVAESHCTQFLDFSLLRKDEIWFLDEKLYSLAEFKDVRTDLNLESAYLIGRFGAIPKL